jgi:hypothetical protein
VPNLLRQQYLLRFAGPVVLSTLLGCGTSFGDVTGKVTYKSKAVSSGTVMLLASDGRPYDGPIDATGTYTIRKVPVGPAKIAVNCFTPVAPETSSAGKKADAKSIDTRVIRSDDTKLAAVSAIPTRYGNFAASKLEVTVVPGRTPHDITLGD